MRIKTNYIFRITIVLAIFITALASCLIIPAGTEEAEIVELEVTVPFGITESHNSETVMIYDRIKNGSIIAELPVGTICAVDKAEHVKGMDWYHICALTADGTKIIGTASESSFHLFSVPELVTVAADPESYEQIQALLEQEEIAAAIDGTIMQDSSLSMAGIGLTRNERLQNTDEIPYDYVVNTSTKKIHLPTCNSVETMKLKNRWDYSGSLQELIDQGYQPCKNCRPDLVD